MKFMKNWKRFFTLNAHHDAGFTLVELIIVIAILAILAGVAVPAYSGYITQANKSNDKTLVGDVANALLLHHYANPNSGSTYVILTPKGVTANPIANEEGIKALEAAFGTNWASQMVLSYGEWSDNGLLQMGIQGGQAVLDSSFLKEKTPSELMGDVTVAVGTSLDFLNDRNYTGNRLYTAMADNLGEDTMVTLCGELGIPLTEDADGNPMFGEGVTNEQLSNMLVLAATRDYLGAIENEREPLPAGQIMFYYTKYMAVANNPTYGSKAMRDSLEAALKQPDVPTIIRKLSEFGTTYEDEIAAYELDEGSIGETDAAAITNILNAVNKVSGEVTADQLNTSNFFGSDVVTGYMNTYLTAAELATQIGTVPEGAVVVMLGINEFGEPVVTCTCTELLAK